MPSWGIHLAISNNIANKLNIKNKNDFIFGNILPDINNAYVIKNVEKIIPHKITHFNNIVKNENDSNSYDNFYKKYKNYLDHPVILGYLVHLISDKYYNNETYKKRGIFNQQGELIGIKLNNDKVLIDSKDEIMKTKHNDFNIFANYIYNNYNLDYEKYNSDFLVCNNIIKEIYITQQDSKNAINYINKNIKANIQKTDKQFKIFTIQEMIEQLDNCSNFIIEFLNSKN